MKYSAEWLLLYLKLPLLAHFAAYQPRSFESHFCISTRRSQAKIPVKRPRSVICCRSDYQKGAISGIYRTPNSVNNPAISGQWLDIAGKQGIGKSSDGRITRITKNNFLYLNIAPVTCNMLSSYRTLIMQWFVETI